MANKEVFFRGKAHWFKLLNQGDQKYQCWSTSLYLDDASYNLFMELKKGNETTTGILNDVKLTDEGYSVTLKRPWLRKYKGSEMAFSAPIVLDVNNHPWPQDKQVGNGSTVTIKCEYYSFKPPFQNKKGSAIRLVSARIEDLVPYEPEKDFDADLKEASKGLAQKPTQYF